MGENVPETDKETFPESPRNILHWGHLDGYTPTWLRGKHRREFLVPCSGNFLYSVQLLSGTFLAIEAAISACWTQPGSLELSLGASPDVET